MENRPRLSTNAPPDPEALALFNKWLADVPGSRITAVLTAIASVQITVLTAARNLLPPDDDQQCVVEPTLELAKRLISLCSCEREDVDRVAEELALLMPEKLDLSKKDSTH